MKKNNDLKKYLKKISGKIIGIGIDDINLVDIIEKNNLVLECDLLNSISKNKGNSNGKAKRIQIKKIKKLYYKKTIDYMIINIEEIKKYLKTFIKDSIFLTNKEICYYVKDCYDKDLIVKRYKRYTKKIEVKEYEDGYIIKINTENTKNKFIKDKIYYIQDTLYNISDIIGNVLAT